MKRSTTHSAGRVTSVSGSLSTSPNLHQALKHRFGSRYTFGRPVTVLACSLVVILSTISCGTNLGVLEPKDLCKCIPLAPKATDYRHLAKHVPIPTTATIETHVTAMLTWKQDLAMAPDAPRSGRELQVFHIASAYLQNASVNSEDCDIHLEISQVPDKGAARVVVETPVDTEYCTARQGVQAMLAQHGFQLDTQHGGELAQSIPVQVKGLAFEDFEHNRGSAQIATVWELHPAIVTAP